MTDETQMAQVMDATTREKPLSLCYYCKIGLLHAFCPYGE